MNFAKDTMKVALKNGKQELANHLKIQIMNYKSNLIFKEINNNFSIISDSKDFASKSKNIINWHIKNNTKYVFKNVLKTAIYKMFKNNK